MGRSPGGIPVKITLGTSSLCPCCHSPSVKPGPPATYMFGFRQLHWHAPSDRTQAVPHPNLQTGSPGRGGGCLVNASVCSGKHVRWLASKIIFRRRCRSAVWLFPFRTEFRAVLYHYFWLCVPSRNVQPYHFRHTFAYISTNCGCTTLEPAM